MQNVDPDTSTEAIDASTAPHGDTVELDGHPADADPARRAGAESRLFPRVTSFRSRRGKLTEPQQACWDRRWSELGRVVGDDPIDTDAWFGRTAPLILEVGSGTGTATVALAAAAPEVDHIAIEVYQPGLAQTMQQIERTYDTDHPIRNVRLVRGDAVEVLKHMIAPGSLTGVRVLFPDPWPKARHHKRRFVQSGTVAMIVDRLKPGGILHVATDHEEYAEAIAEVVDAEPGLARFDTTAQPSPIVLERPITKFEDKGIRAGRPIADMVWGKITR